MSEEREKMLDVRNLRISFRTNNGTVKAVRGINFELYKGETLAIVGESGSGKSVTSRAILGIQAPNKIVEGGEIIYDGKDLLKITEDDFHEIRGSKISMIFQDPMSSLDPIMRIGKQLTEAMILKGKATQKEARFQSGKRISRLKKAMIRGLSTSEEDATSRVEQNIKIFQKTAYIAAQKEKRYNIAYEASTELLSQTKDLLDGIHHSTYRAISRTLFEIKKKLKISLNEYIVNDEEYIQTMMSKINVAIKSCNKLAAKKVQHTEDSEDIKILIFDLTKLQERFGAAVKLVKPDFFAMGYYLYKQPEANVLVEDVESLNKEMRKFLDDNFLVQFEADVKVALQKQYEIKDLAKEEALKSLKQNASIFEEESLSREKCIQAIEENSLKVKAAINKLRIVKNSLAYTYSSSMMSAIEAYFNAVVKNPKEQARYDSEYKEYEEKVALRKYAVKPVPPTIIDLELSKEQISLINARLIESFEKELELAKTRNYDELVIEYIKYLEKQESLMVYKVTSEMAKEKAIEIMAEVGIPEPRKRFTQYPFEFSGGMRQRIVIAIALAANPDILICDEPTTALDVTIQAQILELINRLKRERELSIIFITHNLGVVANMADRIAVMYAGKIVEYGDVEEIFYDPRHPYTWALLSSMPDLETKEKLEAIPGTPPNMIFPPVGDAFAARNKYAMKIDFEQQPPLFEVTPTHYAATWLLHPEAPHVEPPKIVTERIERMKKKEGGGSDGR